MDAVLGLPVLASTDEAFDFFLGVCSCMELKAEGT
jgi:hypothetical protein